MEIKTAHYINKLDEIERRYKRVRAEMDVELLTPEMEEVFNNMKQAEIIKLREEYADVVLILQQAVAPIKEL